MTAPLSWGEFAQAAPAIAERGERLLRYGIAYMATSNRDGAPRVHPFVPLLAEGRLLAFIGVHTVKYANLRRDGRYAVHAALGGDDEEFLIIGRAVPSDDWASRMLGAIAARKIDMTSRDDVLFELRIERAHWAIWEGLGTPEISRRAERWPKR